MRRKIAIITGTRAEFGLLQSLIEDVHQDPELELLLYVTGSHLSDAHGRTEVEIENAGFPIAQRVPILDDSPQDVRHVARATSRAITGFVEAFIRDKPTAAVVLGDRYEILAVASAALIAGVPLVHLHGGEITEGAIDDSIRHAVTKLSHLHFVANEEYRNRVIQLGESPDRVVISGALALDAPRRLKLLSSEETAAFFGLQWQKHVLVAALHPTTHQLDQLKKQVEAFLGALEDQVDCTIVLTYANADVGGDVVNEAIARFAAKDPIRRRAVSSVGSQKYWSLMKVASALVGNSSSGIIEAPLINVPAVNIGDRQKGRSRAKTVIDVDFDRQAIGAAIRRAIDPQFRKQNESRDTPYGRDELASEIILKVLKTYDFSKVLQKKFHDLK